MFIRLTTGLRSSAHHRVPKPSHILSMTVTTIPAPAPVSSGQPSQRKPFSTTQPDEASRFQTAKTSGPHDLPSYVLTLRTSPDLHASMTKLRDVYFPPKLNKLDAHITLFHALPGEKLETDVLPVIKDMVSNTQPYRIRAEHPFRLKAGVGIAIADDVDHANKGKHGRNMTRIIHAELRKKWGDWLSDQDSQPVRMHYTVMNKVNDDQTVDRAFKKLKTSFYKGLDVSGGQFNHDKKLESSEEEDVVDKEKCDKLVTEGLVEGLTLWRYSNRSGRWIEPVQFDFAK